MTCAPSLSRSKPIVSVGIIARNEEDVIGLAIESLLRQTLFSELAARGQTAEIFCLANACTDGTAQRAREVMGKAPAGVEAFVLEIPEKGKINSWNRFVHEFSAREASVLFLMDGDIVIREADAFSSMYRLLENFPTVNVAVDQPVKDIGLTAGRGLGSHISLGASRMTQAQTAQLTGQLYAIRASTVRNIYLPRDLGACEDGFVKALVCTDFMTHPVISGRIQRAAGASHVFEAYTAPGDVLRNQKRRIIGQTMLHILLDHNLGDLPLEQRRDLAGTLRALDERDPEWLKRLLADHLHRSRYFWRLYPGILTAPWKRWRKLPSADKPACLPAMIAGLAVGTTAAWLARRALTRGNTDYWPDTRSLRIAGHHATGAAAG